MVSVLPEEGGRRRGRLRRHDEALAAYDRAIELKPDYAAALSNRANVLLELKRVDAALASGRPCLIDVEVDPVGYGRQLKAMRG